MDSNKKDEDNKSQFNHFSSFAFLWAVFISILNLFQAFSVFFWVSIEGFPNDINLSIEILLELIYLLDIILRLCLRKYARNNNRLYFLNHLYNESSPIADTFIMIGSLPYIITISVTGHFIYIDTNNNDLYSYLLFIKLFRFFDLLRTRDKLHKLLNSLNFSFVIFYRFLVTIIILMFTTHIAACFWLIVNKAESSDRNFYAISRFKYNNFVDQYVLALEWAVSSMTGSCFGDVTPTTNLEVLTSVIIMVIGSTFYCQIFADFETIIYVSRMEKLEKKL